MRTSILLALFLAGCLERPAAPSVPCVATGFTTSIETEPTAVDLLFVVDDSPSMREEQASLATQIPRLVRVLTSGDRDLDGTPDFTPVSDLHAGVVTVNMGVGGNHGVDTCTASPDFGDDGVLVTTPRIGGPGCAASYPHFLSFDGATDAAQFAVDFTCLARTGTGGCGYEQQLDAPLKALLPAGSPITFYAGTHGHGDDPTTNGGFLRRDSLIVVVDITDEDDCSTDVTDVWATHPVSHPGDPNLRCIDYASELYDVRSRFVDGLRSLRPGQPNRVIFATITGLPLDLVGQSYAQIFADPRMQNHVTTHPDGSRTLDPACVSASGAAAPGIRMAHAAEGFGENGIVQSICASDYGPALDVVLARIVHVLDGVCLPRQLQPDATGKVGCDVVETFVPATDGSGPQQCSDLAGADATPVSIDADGAVRCRVTELAVTADMRAGGVLPAGTGWYYDDFSTTTAGSCGDGQRVAFTADAVPSGGVQVGLQCVAHVATASMVCTTDADCPAPLACGGGSCVNPICL